MDTTNTPELSESTKIVDWRQRLSERSDMLKVRDPETWDQMRAFAAANGIPPLKRQGHTEAQLDLLSQWLSVNEGPFELTPSEAAAAEAGRIASTLSEPREIRTVNRRRADEGAPVGDDVRTALNARHAALHPEAKLWFEALVSDANRARFPLHMKDNPSELRASILYAALDLASLAASEPQDGYPYPEEMIRALVSYVTGETWPQWPTTSMGAVFGALTIDEARRLSAMSPALTRDIDWRLGLDGELVMPELVSA